MSFAYLLKKYSLVFYFQAAIEIAKSQVEKGAQILDIKLVHFQRNIFKKPLFYLNACSSTLKFFDITEICKLNFP